MKKYSVKEIVEKSGGYGYFFDKYGLTNFAVRAWYSRGIPRRYWRFISKATGIEESEIGRAVRMATPRKKKAAGKAKSK